MMTLNYLAYGSNLHPLRLMERVPSAQFKGVAKLQGYRLVFEKQGRDGSSKCNLLNTGMAIDVAHAAIYQLEAQHKPLLDQFEDLGAGYIDAPVEVQLRGRGYRCFSYFAQPEFIVEDLKPYHWYKGLVLQGAEYLQLPDDYVSGIKSVESIPDGDVQRQRAHQSLILRMSEYPLPG